MRGASHPPAAGRRWLVLVALGFASGLPSAYKTLGSTLQAWLIDLRYDVADVTLFTLVTLPIGLKVLWAPALDRFVPPFLGRRRGWLFVLQALLAASLAAIAWFGPDAPGQSLVPLAVTAAVAAALSASQDAVADAYRTDVLAPPERGVGAAMFVNGYRIGLLAAGGGALALSDVLPWRVVYLALAGAMGVGIAATLLAQEPVEPEGRPATLGAAVVEPWREVARRFGPRFVVLLLFVAAFRVPDFAAGALTAPLLLDEIGFPKATVALVRDGMGLAVALAGAFSAIPLVSRLGLYRSLWLFGALQAVSNLGFCVLAAVGRSDAALVAVVAVENFCQGLVGAGFVVCLMSMCDVRYSATQYALFTSLMYLVGILLAAPTGGLAQAAGYPWAFAITAAAGLPGLALLPLLRPWVGGPVPEAAEPP